MTKPKYDAAVLAVSASVTTTMTELMTSMGIAITPGSRSAMWARLSNYGIDTRHWVRSPSGRRRYDDDALRSAVAASQSVAQVLRLLGIKPAGGSHFHISKRIRLAGLDTTHFLGQAIRRGLPGPRKPAEEVLRRLGPGAIRTKRGQLLRAMAESGVDYVCGGCGIGPQWRGRPLTLAVDHIDGDWLNNLLENLRFLCPNCHARTATWCRQKLSSNLT